MATRLSDDKRQMVIENWVRVLLSNSFSINDISKIILEFGSQYEKFDTSISVKAIKFTDDDLTVFFNEDDDKHDSQSAFGLMDAIPGKEYHWKVKIMSEE